MKKIMSSILALSLMVTAFTACSSNKSIASSTPDSTIESSSAEVVPQELKKIKIGYGNHLGCSLWFIAEEMDLFKDYGLDVELTAFASSADQLAAIQSGQIFGGSAGGTASFASIAQGADISLWGGQMHEGSGIITLPENAELCSDFANYKGKKLGLVRMSTGDVVFQIGRAHV